VLVGRLWMLAVQRLACLADLLNDAVALVTLDQAFDARVVMAGGNDVLSSVFRVAPESITNLFRVLIFAVPLAVFFIVRNACRELSRDRVHPFGGTVGSRVRRTPEGGYELIEDPATVVGAIRSDLATTDLYRRPPTPPAET